MGISRREVIRGLGGMGALSAVAGPLAGAAETGREAKKGPVRAIVIGAGDRGNTYARYAALAPDKLQIVGVAEPRPERRQKFAEKYGLAAQNQVDTWERVFDRPRWADAVIVATPDALHYGPAMRAMQLGYHLLLEKPIAPSEQQCLDIAREAERSGVIAGVCHVLRYTPYWQKVRELVQQGALGELVSIDHFEPVGYWHMAHSYVRGNWRRTADSSFMLLAKSCHDLDIVRWVVGEPCRRVTSFGSLKHFRIENAPEGSTARCTDGCKVEPECPYSALKIYLDMRRQGWPASVITSDLSLEGRLKALKEGPYGRCVYRCDNDVVDHQVVAMEFEKGMTGSLTMAAFTPEQGMGMRRTRLMGTRGYLEGDMHELTLTDFRTNKQERTVPGQQGGDAGSGHGGGDLGIISAFTVAVAKGDKGLLTSTMGVSVESHVMAFRAEQARLEGRMVAL